MKVLMIIMVLTFSSDPVGWGQSQVYTQEIIKGEDQRFPVKPEELPEPVKKALADEQYKDWKVSEAYLIQEEQKLYEITLVRGKEKQVIRMDEKGNRLG